MVRKSCKDFCEHFAPSKHLNKSWFNICLQPDGARQAPQRFSMLHHHSDGYSLWRQQTNTFTAICVSNFRQLICSSKWNVCSALARLWSVLWCGIWSERPHQASSRNAGAKSYLRKKFVENAASCHATKLVMHFIRIIPITNNIATNSIFDRKNHRTSTNQ